MRNAGNSIAQIHKNKDIQTLDRHHSFFFYEICPIYTVAKYLSAKAVKFTGSLAVWDGKIDTTACDIVKIECTRDMTTEDRRQESFRKANSAVPAPKLVNWDKITQEESAKLIAALYHKNDDRDQSVKILIITFDDLGSRLERKNYLPALDLFWSQVKDIKRFNRIFVVGNSQKLLWDSYKTGRIF